MTIDVGMELTLEDGQQVVNQGFPARHPLVVRPPAMVVGPVEPRVRKAIEEPPEEGLVPDMHSEGHLGLLPVAAKGPFADQEPHEQAAVEVR